MVNIKLSGLLFLGNVIGQNEKERAERGRERKRRYKTGVGWCCIYISPIVK